MCKKWIAWTMLLAVAVFLGGCGGGEAPQDVAAEQDASGDDSSTPDSAPAPPPPPPAAPADATAQPGAEETPGERPTEAVPSDMEAAPAVGHIGRKGRGYGSGMIATPVAAIFQTRDRIQLIQLASTLNTYKAVNGHLPKSHDEFMTKIVEQNRLQLPQLPPGQEYFYDAEAAATISTVDPADADRMPLKVLRPR